MELTPNRLKQLGWQRINVLDYSFSQNNKKYRFFMGKRNRESEIRDVTGGKNQRAFRGWVKTVEDFIRASDFVGIRYTTYEGQ